MKGNELKRFVESAEGRKKLAGLYPKSKIDWQVKRYKALLDRHFEAFGEKEEVVLSSAPGRTEIVGNHTDHNHGRVLAAAIDMDTLAAASKNDKGVVTLYSEGYEKPFVVDINSLESRDSERETTDALIRGVAARLSELGYKIGGFDATVTSTVFKGSGLSSSAAFEVMLCEVFDALYCGGVLDMRERALISQYAENVYFGKPSGLLDQTASSVGGLVTLDFKDSPSKIEPLSYDFSAKGYDMAVVAAGGDHGNLTNQYASITAEMKMVSKFFGVEFLRDIRPETMFEAIPRLKGKVPERAILRAIHFYDEDARVVKLVNCVKNDDIETFLKGVIASGESSWKLLQNLCVPGGGNQDMPLALELSRRMLEGKGAWRIHGGGFAGTILVFVPKDMFAGYQSYMNSVFGDGACVKLAVRPVGPATIGG